MINFKEKLYIFSLFCIAFSLFVCYNEKIDKKAEISGRNVCKRKGEDAKHEKYITERSGAHACFDDGFHRFGFGGVPQNG